MKITVLGAGAKGSLFGGFLAEAGHEVWLLDTWQEHIQRIKAVGLWIEGVSGARYIKNLKTASSPSEAGSSDIVFIFVKSTDIEQAVRQSYAVFNTRPLIVCLQNGLGNIEKIAAAVERERLIASTTAYGASLIEAEKSVHSR